MGLVTYQQVAAILVFVEPANVRPHGLVTGDEDVEHLGLDEHVQILLHGLAVRFGQRNCLDGARSEPLDELIVPVLDEGARADDDDALGGRGWTGGDAGLEEGPDEGDRLESLAESHVCWVFVWDRNHERYLFAAEMREWDGYLLVIPSMTTNSSERCGDGMTTTYTIRRQY